MVDPLDLAYIAGLFDGEGSAFIITPKASNGKRYPRLIAKISQKDREVLDWVVETIGYGKVYPKLGSPPAKDGCHQFQITARQARTFLTTILPYLRIKKDNVESLLP